VTVLVYRPPQGSILSLRVSTVSVHGPLLLCFEPLKLLNFYLNADMDSDPASHSDADPDPATKKNAQDIDMFCLRENKSIFRVSGGQVGTRTSVCRPPTRCTPGWDPSWSTTLTPSGRRMLSPASSDTRNTSPARPGTRYPFFYT
jgi:hypothetical protein